MVYYPGSIVFVSSFQGDRTQVMEKRFTEFVLVAENAEAVLGAKVDTAREGSYQLLGDVLTRFSDHCTNTGTSYSVMILDYSFTCQMLLQLLMMILMMYEALSDYSTLLRSEISFHRILHHSSSCI